EDNIIEELTFKDVYVVVNPSLLVRAVPESVITAAAEPGKFVDHLVKRAGSAPRGHGIAVIRVAATTGVIMEILLVSVIHDRNAAPGQHISLRLDQAIGVVVDAQQAGHIVAVDKSDQI